MTTPHGNNNSLRGPQQQYRVSTAVNHNQKFGCGNTIRHRVLVLYDIIIFNTDAPGFDTRPNQIVNPFIVYGHGYNVNIATRNTADEGFGVFNETYNT